MRRHTGVTSSLVALLVVAMLSLTGCSGTQGAQPDSAVPDGSSSGTRLGPGLYDQPDGSVLVVGVLVHSDLEGGFWAITAGSAAESDSEQNLAVIANGSEFASQLSALEDRLVEVRGTRLDGASIRMAGPEIEMDSITDITDTGGPAE